MRRVLRHLPVVALGLLLACSGGSAEELLTRSPDALLEQGTVRYQQGVILREAGGPVLLDTTTEGEQDLTTGDQRLVVHVDDATQAQPLAGVEVVLDGRAAYLRSPQLTAVTGAEWARLDLDVAALLPGVDETLGQETGPLALLRQLRGAAEDVEDLGEADVRGVTTRHLRVTVDVARAIEQAPADRREALREAFEQLGVPERYPLELWLDGDALPRRIVTVTQGDDPTFGPTEREMRTDLYDFGVPVDIHPPPADEVADLADLLAGLGAGGRQ